MDSLIEAAPAAVSAPPAEEVEPKQDLCQSPPPEKTVDVSAAALPQDLPELNKDTPPTSKRHKFISAMGTRPRRASRGDAVVYTQPKSIRSAKKAKDDALSKRPTQNLVKGEPILDVALPRRNPPAQLEGASGLSPPVLTEEASAHASTVTEPPLHDKTNASRISPHPSTPASGPNPDSSLISSPLVASEPSDGYGEDNTGRPSSPRPESSPESDQEQSGFDKHGRDDLSQSLTPHVHPSLQEFSSGSISPDKPGSNANQTAWLETAQYRTWKKLAQMVLKDIAHHRLAPLFQRPIKESFAPGYKSIVKRPMDLSTIQSRIKNGFITTTEEFTRDVLLMCQNALMFNRVDTEIHGMAKEMLASVQAHLDTLNAAVYNSTTQQPSSCNPPLPPAQQ